MLKKEGPPPAQQTRSNAFELQEWPAHLNQDEEYRISCNLIITKGHTGNKKKDSGYE